MGERLKQALIDRGRKIIVVQNPALDLEAEHVIRSRKTVRDEQTSRNFSLFGEPISEAHKIVARKSRPFDLFAHLTIRRIRRATGARRPQIRPFLGPISYPWDDDASTPGNPGLRKAREAAKAVGALLAVPDFGRKR